MNRFILTLLLLAPLLCHAQSTSRMLAAVARKKAVSVGCATTDTALPHDTLLEGFQGAAEENTWTAVSPGAGEVTFDDDYDTSSLTSNKPTGACNEGLRVVAVGADGNSGRYYHDLGAAIDLDAVVVDVYFSFYLESGLPTGGQSLTILCPSQLDTGATEQPFKFSMRNNGGTPQVQVVAGSTTANQTISTGTWISIHVHLDTATTGSTSYFTIDGGSQIVFDRSAFDFRYLHLGAPDDRQANEDFTVVFDIVAINTP